MLILSPEDRAALWHKTITSDPDSRDGMLRVLAKEIQDLVGAELSLYDFDEQLERSVRLLDASGFLGRDELRRAFEEVGEETDEEDDSTARFALTLSGYLEETADVGHLAGDDRVAALELAGAWREAVVDAHGPATETMTVAEVASHFGVTPQAVYKWCQAGKIDFERTPGGSYRIPTGQFDLERGRETRRAREELKRRLLERYGDRPPMSDDEIAAAIEAARRRSTG
jgi:excisionase family DNA binding protein